MKSILLFAASLLFCLTTIAQDKPAPSPSSKLVQTVGLTQVTVEYSRPGAKDRTVYGELVPYGEIWRTGANLATKISFDKAVTIGGTELAAGSYAVLTVPGKKEWTVNLYKFDKAGWGSYRELDATASVSVASQSLSTAVETFTIDINNLRDTSATIDLIWEKTKVSVPLTVGTN